MAERHSAKKWAWRQEVGVASGRGSGELTSSKASGKQSEPPEHSPRF